MPVTSFSGRNLTLYVTVVDLLDPSQDLIWEAIRTYAGVVCGATLHTGQVRCHFWVLALLLEEMSYLGPGHNNTSYVGQVLDLHIDGLL